MKTKKSRKILLCVVSMILVGCKGNKNLIKTEPQVAGYQVSYPKVVTGSLHNPGMGWVTLEEQTEWKVKKLF